MSESFIFIEFSLDFGSTKVKMLYFHSVFFGAGVPKNKSVLFSFGFATVRASLLNNIMLQSAWGSKNGSGARGGKINFLNKKYMKKSLF